MKTKLVGVCLLAIAAALGCSGPAADHSASAPEGEPISSMDFESGDVEDAATETPGVAEADDAAAAGEQEQPASDAAVSSDGH